MEVVKHIFRGNILYEKHVCITKHVERMYASVGICRGIYLWGRITEIHAGPIKRDAIDRIFKLTKKLWLKDERQYTGKLQVLTGYFFV